MKKLLGILLVCALVVPAAANNIFSNVETYGEIQTIGARVADIPTKANDYSVTTNRVLFGLGMDLVEDVRANVSFLNTSTWGDAITAGNLGQGQDVNGFLDETFIVEANVVVSNIFGALEAKVGRQFYGDEDSKVIYFGPTHYRANLAIQDDAQSFDGAVVSYSSDRWMAEVVYGKLTEATATPTQDLDQTLLGGNVKFSINENLMAQAYIYDIRDRKDVDTHGGIYGIKPTFTNDNLKVSAEFAKNYEGDFLGQNNRGWMVAADVALTLAGENFDLTPRASYYKTEKHFENNGNYAPGLLFGGVIGGRTQGVWNANDVNYQIFNAGVDFKFANLERFSFAFDYYAISTGPSDNAEWGGNEFDLVAKYALNEYVELHAGAAYALNVNEGISTKDPYMGQLGMLIRF